MQRKAGEGFWALNMSLAIIVINIIIRKTGAEKSDVAGAFSSAEDGLVICGHTAAIVERIVVFYVDLMSDRRVVPRQRGPKALFPASDPNI